MEIVQRVKKVKFNLASAIELSETVLCTTLYKNPMQVSNFDGAFDQLFLWIYLRNFHGRCLSTLSIPWCKKVKNDQNLNQGGGGPALRKQYFNSPSAHRGISCTFLVGWQTKSFWTGHSGWAGRQCRRKELPVRLAHKRVCFHRRYSQTTRRTQFQAHHWPEDI